MKKISFDYDKAISRNIGWFSEYEQQQLRTKKVAIAGMGGVGGFHLFTLTRLGISKFHIADFDEFEIHNFNRQIGATMKTIGRSKAEVMDEIAKNINPECEITIFKEGVTDDNLDEFLKGVDLYIDGLDFFVLEARSKVYARCRELNIPVITAGPIGMGTAYFIFMPDKMSFEEYFRFKGYDDIDQRFHFLIGLIPKPIPLKYLAEQRFDMNNKKGPSTVVGCELCAGVMGAQAVKILLKHEKIYAVPYYHFFDAYLGKFHRGYMPFGNGNLIQRLRLFFIKRAFAKQKKETLAEPPVYSSDLEKILDISRWAPSGDNAQPWKFEIVDDETVLIHVDNDSKKDIYNFGGIPTSISCGGLLEIMRIAASQFGRNCQWSLSKKSKETYIIEVVFKKEETIQKDSLFHFIKFRSVNRYRYRTTPLTEVQKKLLEESLGDHLQIKWFSSFKERYEMAKINFLSTQMRFTIPELREPILKIVDNQQAFSPDKIPIDAVGLNSVSKMAMQWSLKNPERFDFICKAGAAFFSSLELDFLPGLACSAHFIIWSSEKMKDTPDIEFLLKTGESIQRFWLTATRLGLVIQPSFLPLLFDYYAEKETVFSKESSKIKKLVAWMNQLFGHQTILFKGRIGLSKTRTIKSRSVRKPLEELLVKRKL